MPRASIVRYELQQDAAQRAAGNADGGDDELSRQADTGDESPHPTRAVSNQQRGRGVEGS